MSYLLAKTPALVVVSNVDSVPHYFIFRYDYQQGASQMIETALAVDEFGNPRAYTTPQEAQKVADAYNYLANERSNELVWDTAEATWVW